LRSALVNGTAAAITAGDSVTVTHTPAEVICAVT
jgi:hypothetical protein